MLSPDRQGQLRIYDAGDRTRLKLILRGKRLGLDLQESREIIAMYSPGTNNQQQLKALLAKIEEKKIQLVRQQEDLDAMFEDLKLWEKNCTQALLDM